MVAKSLADAAAARGAEPVRNGLVEREPGQRLPTSCNLPLLKESPEAWLRVMLDEIWNKRRLYRLAEFYSSRVFVQTAPGREVNGLSGLTWLYIRMLAAFPDARFHFGHFCDVEETDGYIAAVRWTIKGTHTGNGLFGRPSGNPVSILGMSHFRFRDDMIVQEWTV